MGESREQELPSSTHFVTLLDSQEPHLQGGAIVSRLLGIPTEMLTIPNTYEARIWLGGVQCCNRDGMLNCTSSSVHGPGILRNYFWEM